MSMGRRPLSKSGWKPSVLPWHPLRRRGSEAAAGNPALSPEFRLWLLAVSRVGASGHAVFEPGEVQELLPKLIRSTGEFGVYSERGIRKLIASLVDGEVLAPDSNTRCLVIPMSLLDPNHKSPVNCPEHCHKLAWTGTGWVGINNRTGFVEAVA